MRDLFSKAMLLIFCGASIQAVAMDDDYKENNSNPSLIRISKRPAPTPRKWSRVAKQVQPLNKEVMLRASIAHIPAADFQEFLNLAASKGDILTVAALLNAGAEVNGVHMQRAPLHVATEPEMLEFLLDKGADLNLRNKRGLKPIHLFINDEVKNWDSIKIFISHGADVDVTNDEDRNLLELALDDYRTNWDLIAWLLEQGFDFNIAHSDGRSLLDIACSNGQNHIIEFILNKKIDLNRLNKRGYAPLHYACHANEKRAIELLLTHGANPFFIDKNGFLPIHKLDASKTDLIEMLEQKMFEIAKQ